MDQHNFSKIDPVFICEAVASDYDAIYDIYVYYIQNSNNNWNHQPKSSGSFKSQIDELCKIGRPTIVARQNNSVVGYGMLHDFRSADGYWPCVENSIYVHPDYQGQRIGGQLMAALISQAKSCQLWAIIAVIDSANESSILFHERYGFIECGRMNQIGEKNHQVLSVVFLQYDIPENRNQYLITGRSFPLFKGSLMPGWSKI